MSHAVPHRRWGTFCRRAGPLWPGSTAGHQMSKFARTQRPPPEVPDDLALALKKNKQALATFNAFSPRRQREYVYWIRGAKKPITRGKRVTTAIAWMAEGKPRF